MSSVVCVWSQSELCVSGVQRVGGDEVLVVGTSTVDRAGGVGAARHRCATRATAGATIMLDIARCCALLLLHGGELWHRPRQPVS